MSKDIELEHESGSRHESLQAAQQAGLQAVASALAQVVRANLERDRYVVEDGVIQLAPEIRKDREPLTRKG